MNKLKSQLEIFKIENQKLKDNLNITTQSQTNEMNKLKSELEIFKAENEKLKSDLLKANKIISGIQTNQKDDNEIKKLKEENGILIYKLNVKDNEINDLKLKIQNNVNDLPKYNINEIMVVNFMSQDSSINEGVKCLPTDVFAEVEEKLYKKYDKFRNTNNTFLANAKVVLRFKKINENGIKDGDKIQLITNFE
jgi:molybdopterin converting factor small subunit